MEHVYTPYSFAEAQAAFKVKSQPWHKESDGWFSFGISEKSTNEKIGNIGLKIVDHQAAIAEVGFMIKLNAQGKGYAGEALNLIKDYAFSELKLTKLIAICSTKNTACYQMLEKHHFTREQVILHNSIINSINNGSYVDDYLYGLHNSQ